VAFVRTVKTASGATAVQSCKYFRDDATGGGFGEVIGDVVGFGAGVDDVVLGCDGGSGADHYNALAETVNGFYKSELIYGPARTGPWKTIEDVELAT